MATAPAASTPTVPAPRITSRAATVLQMLAVATLFVVIGWVAVQVFATDTTDTIGATAQSFDEGAETERLARTGQIPAAAHDVEAEATRRLTARGLIPTAPAATVSTVSTTAPVDEAAETARLVTRGLVPAATLQPTGEEAETARLVTRGLVPAATLQPTGEEAMTESLISRGLVPEGTQP